MKHKVFKGIVSFICFISCLLAITGLLDQRGEAYIDQSLTRALVVFGIARGLNGAISVAQGTEVALEPAGIGVNFAPGQILDPVNDLVERFSWVMLVSSTSLGLQKVLLSITSWPFFSHLSILILIFTSIAIWHPSFQEPGPMRGLIKLTCIIILIRFSVPLIAISSEVVYYEFLSGQYTEATQILKRTTKDISAINKTAEQELPEQKGTSFWESAMNLYDSATESLDIEGRIEQYKMAVGNATRHTINLIVIFVFQTIVFPLAFLFGVYLLTRRMLRSRHSYLIEDSEKTVGAL